MSDAPDAPDGADAVPAAPGLAPEERRKLKVMVIDDDRDIRFVVAMNLKVEGYDVVECADGMSALRDLAAQRPDIVVCDIMMPGIDGYQVLEQLRAVDGDAHTPLIFLSAKATDEEVWDGWCAGADYYLTKPFEPDELLAFVRHCAEQLER